MEQKIKEVKDYFIGKLLKGDFTTDKITEYVLEIIIDKKYHFYLWICNGPNYLHSYYMNGKYSYMELELELLPEDQKVIWTHIKPIISLWKVSYLYDMKKKEMDKLEKELKELKH